MGKYKTSFTKKIMMMDKEDNDIIIPSSEDIIAINKTLGFNIINQGAVDFLIARIEAKTPKKDYKRQIATIAAILWFEIIRGHPFADGNKRTATEAMKLFLKKNNHRLNTTLGGLVYISMKIANNEISYQTLIDWIYERIENGNLH
ncbi:fic/DOC family protein [archaeon BMS3Bbin16]|nr:fic/DOC family protein [archaeon BMS3Bbin16]